MTITKYDRVSILPKRCDRCNRLFWLEPYNIFYKTVGIEEYSLKQIECKNCISREAAIKVFGDVHPMDYNTQAYVTKIQNLPSVTPKPKIGHWILYRDHKNMMDYPQCDNCGVIIKLPLPIDNLNYCPNCGCRMAESEEV